MKISIRRIQTLRQLDCYDWKTGNFCCKNTKLAGVYKILQLHRLVFLKQYDIGLIQLQKGIVLITL
jgi:hypothetical protein